MEQRLNHTTMKVRPPINARFALGRTVATGAALSALRHSGLDAGTFFRRHHQGDWGHLDPSEIRRNERALLLNNGRIRSTYNVSDQCRIVIVTEADHSFTMMLMMEEY